jgi:hypothetical protein
MTFIIKFCQFVCWRGKLDPKIQGIFVYEHMHFCIYTDWPFNSASMCGMNE